MIGRSVFVWVVFMCFAVVAPCLLSLSCYADDLVKKHVAFARTLLESPDEMIHAAALDVVLASAPSDGLQLARKALEVRAEKAPGDGEDAVRLTALGYLAGHADKECVRVVRDLLTKRAHPQNVRRGYLDITASLAAEVLLRSDDQEARKQAIDWIEELLAHPDELGMWEDAAGKVGKHHLSQLKAHLTGSKIQGDQRGIAAAALAKLGDEPSKRLMQEKLTDPRLFSFIVNDRELVKLLGLTCKQIENALPSRAELEKQHHEWKEKDSSVEWFLAQNEVAMAQACAYLGHPEHLRGLSRQMLELSKPPRTSAKGVKLVSILYAIKDAGDEGMLPVLEEFFANVSTNEGEFYCPIHSWVVRSTSEPNGDAPKCPLCGMSLSAREKGAPNNGDKLEASLAVVKIVSRHDGHNPAPSERKSHP